MICQYCQREFEPRYSWQKHCSKRCAHAYGCANYRAAHPDRVKESQERFKEAHPERAIEIKEKYRRAHPDQYATYSSKRREKHPEQVIAQHAVSHAVRDGRMERGAYCERCGTTDKIEAHHHLGYAPENRLNIIWLCHKCHSKADREA